MLAFRFSKTAGGQGVICPGLDGHGIHSARAAVAVKGDGHAMAAGIKLRSQPGYDRRNVIAGCVQVPIAAKPLKVAACISVRAGQTVGRRRGKALACFHNNLDSIQASA